MTRRKHLKSVRSYSSVLPLVNTIEKFIKNFLYSQTFPVCAGARENCPHKQSTKRITVLKCPRIWVVNLIWQERYTNSSDLLQVISAFPDRIQLNTIYKTHEKQWFLLKGFIAYGLDHYVAYLYSTSTESWKKYDDELVQEIPDKFYVISDMIEVGMHPVGVQYEYSKFSEPPQLSDHDWLILEKQALAADQSSLILNEIVDTQTLSTNEEEKASVNTVKSNSAHISSSHSNSAICSICHSSIGSEKYCNSCNSLISYNYAQCCIDKSTVICLNCKSSTWVCSTCKYRNSRRFRLCKKCCLNKLT